MDPNLPPNPPSPNPVVPNPVTPVPPASRPPLPSLSPVPPSNPSNPPNLNVPPETPSTHPPSLAVARQPTGGGGPRPASPNPPTGGAEAGPKKSHKLFAGIVGLIVLISALAGGLILVSQKQLFQKEAFNQDYQGPCCNANGCYTSNNGCSTPGYDYPTYWVNRYHCPDITSGACSADQYLVETAVTHATFQEDCGIEQIDIASAAGYSGQFSSRNYDTICFPPPEPTPTPTATPIPTATPTLPPGVPQCVSASISPTVLPSGGNATFTSTATINADTFWYLLYNRDNEYGPGNPKPICVNDGFGDDGVGGDCAVAGTHQLMYKAVYANPRLTGSKVLNYNQLFVVDRNNNDQIVSRVQSNAYFQVNGGGWSTLNPDCVAYVSALLPTGTPIPTNTPVPTNTPQPTPTLPPGVVAQCTNILVQKQVPGGWQDITDPATQANIGDQLRFLVFGSTNNGSFTKAAFFINHSAPIEVTATITIGSQTYFVTEYTLTAGPLTVEAVLYHSTEGWVD